MAQKITRTIVSTLVTCKVLDREAEEFATMHIILPGKITEQNKICKMCNKEANLTGKVLVKVLDVQNIEALYEMPLETFIANATVVTE